MGAVSGTASGAGARTATAVVAVAELVGETEEVLLAAEGAKQAESASVELLQLGASDNVLVLERSGGGERAGRRREGDEDSTGETHRCCLWWAFRVGVERE